MQENFQIQTDLIWGIIFRFALLVPKHLGCARYFLWGIWQVELNEGTISMKYLQFGLMALQLCIADQDDCGATVPNSGGVPGVSLAETCCPSVA